MSKYFRIHDDFMQEVSISEDGCVDLLEFVSVAYRVQ